MENDKLKVLVIDDNPQFLETMKKSLENKGCIVQCASDQSTALSFLINEIFHIAFVDCVLNSGQGADIIQGIRETLGNSVEIIMMSGIVPEKSLSSYIDLGVCDFLSKPISEKEIEENLNRLKEKRLSGNSQNILIKLFRDSISSIQSLKLLISLKKAKDCEFFLYLGKALASKESLCLKLQFNNKRHKIICSQGSISSYECENSNIFLNQLSSRGYISDAELSQFRGYSQKEIERELLKRQLLSAMQISDIKYDMMIDALKEIVPGVEISVEINLLAAPKKPAFFILNQSQYADLAFLFLKQKFNARLFSFFDEEIMKRSLIFKGEQPDFLPDAQGFLSEARSGMKLRSVYNKHASDKSYFCSCVIYILLKGGACLSEGGLNVKYSYLIERYKSLYKFISSKNIQPKDIFLYISALPRAASITLEEIKTAYFRFVKHNHPDTLPPDIPSDLLNLTTNLLSQMKNLYDSCIDPQAKSHEEKKHKKQRLEKEILWAEKKKICERYLEERKNEKAFSIIKSMPPAVIERETPWQLLYLWLYFQNKKKLANEGLAHKSMKIIQAKARDLHKEKLYQYVLGLYHESKGNYSQAKIAFEITKTLEPSFQPCYPAIKRCSLMLLKAKQKNQPFIAKLKSISLSDLSLNNLKKKAQKKSAS